MSMSFRGFLPFLREGSDLSKEYNDVRSTRALNMLSLLSSIIRPEWVRAFQKGKDREEIMKNRGVSDNYSYPIHRYWLCFY